MKKYILILCFLSTQCFAASYKGTISANVVQSVTIDNSGAVSGEQPSYCETDSTGNVLCYY